MKELIKQAICKMKTEFTQIKYAKWTQAYSQHT